MLVLALDTSTPAVSVAVVDGGAPEPAVLAERVEVAANRHGELLAPLVAAALRQAGATRRDLAAVAVGLGPGPFTGLRVGLVTAAALADALAIPAYGACSLDLVAARHAGEEPFLAATDARRREVYWARYSAGGERLEGPAVDAPAVVAERWPELRAVGAGAVAHRELFARVDERAAYPSVVHLAGLAASRARAGEPADPLTPLYLRRPDARPPGPRKQVTPA